MKGKIKITAKMLKKYALITILVVKIDSCGPAIFKQPRIGEDGRTFTIYKFRSMTSDNDVYDFSKKDKVTKIGKFLRKSGIDELPQLINVIKGDMSLIGPRPYLLREKDDMGEWYDTVVKCKPGITGYWQVNGRNDTDFDYRLELDHYYLSYCL